MVALSTIRTKCSTGTLLIMLLYDFYIFFVLVVEDLQKNRQTLASLEAIYLITPSKSSIDILIKDFSNSGSPMYKAAHVFLTEGKVIIKFKLYRIMIII